MGQQHQMKHTMGTLTVVLGVLMILHTVSACGGGDEDGNPLARSTEPTTTAGEMAATPTETARTTTAPGSGSPQTDRQVLVTLYDATDGPNWRDNTNWLSEAPIGEWYGVSTDGNGRVVRLELEANQLRGKIASELGNLANLEWLELRENYLTGGIPPELGNLARLYSLDLTANQLTGEIPSVLGNLDGLRGLGLGWNQFTGEISSVLDNLGNSEYLDIGNTHLRGCVPIRLKDMSEIHDSDLGGLPFCD